MTDKPATESEFYVLFDVTIHLTRVPVFKHLYFIFEVVKSEVSEDAYITGFWEGDLEELLSKRKVYIGI